MKIYLLIILIGVFLTGIIIGAIVVSLNVSTQLSFALFIPRSIDFNSFSGLLLASISVIFTFFGIFVAVLAFFGFNSIKEKVEQTAKQEVEQSTKEGHLKDLMQKVALQEMKTALQNGGEIHQLAVKTFQEAQFRGTGLAESSGAEDPIEDE